MKKLLTVIISTLSIMLFTFFPARAYAYDTISYGQLATVTDFSGGM